MSSTRLARAAVHRGLGSSTWAADASTRRPGHEMFYVLKGRGSPAPTGWRSMAGGAGRGGSSTSSSVGALAPLHVTLMLPDRGVRVSDLVALASSRAGARPEASSRDGESAVVLAHPVESARAPQQHQAVVRRADPGRPQREGRRGHHLRPPRRGEPLATPRSWPGRRRREAVRPSGEPPSSDCEVTDQVGRPHEEQYHVGAATRPADHTPRRPAAGPAGICGMSLGRT